MGAMGQPGQRLSRRRTADGHVPTGGESARPVGAWEVEWRRNERVTRNSETERSSVWSREHPGRARSRLNNPSTVSPRFRVKFCSLLYNCRMETILLNARSTNGSGRREN